MIVVRPPAVVNECTTLDPLDLIHKESGDALMESKQLFVDIRKTLDTGKAPGKELLQDWKRKVKRINIGISKATRSVWRELDRSKIEMETLKINTARDILDERSNMARVLERIRTYTSISDSAVERSLVSTASVQNMMASLTSTPETGFHGAPFLSNDVRNNQDSLDEPFKLATS